MLSNARRLSLPCALITIFILIADPLSAQIKNDRAAGTLPLAPTAILGGEWLGLHPPIAPDLNVARPLWQGPGAMIVEQQLAQRAIRSWWPRPVADAKADAVLNGFAWYLQTRGTEQLFDYLYLRTAHSVESRKYFGGHVIWSFTPLRLSRHAAARRDRYAAVFDSLERWIGTPTLQAAMFQIAHLPLDQLTANVILKTMSDAAGQDLSWAFDAGDADVDYAVESLSEKTVTVSRRGTGTFTGRTHPRVGAFDSGDALRLKVLFADGKTAFASWDGRDQKRTFTFESTSPIVAAYLDPDGIVTMDRNRLDNAIVAPSPTNVPVTKWVARWMVWLQHTMLSYGFLA